MATIYLSDKYSFTLNQFMPIIHLIAFCSNHMSHYFHIEVRIPLLWLWRRYSSSKSEPAIRGPQSAGTAYLSVFMID